MISHEKTLKTSAKQRKPVKKGHISCDSMNKKCPESQIHGD